MTVDSQESAMGRPCMLVVHDNAHQASALARAFRRLGWDVYHARSGAEARRLARMLEPELLVMATDLEEESGWLTCEKLTREQPRVKVFLVGDATEQRNHAFAAFVGAVRLLDGRDGVQSLVEDVCGRTLPAAG
ncbi:MAG: response regulator [Planctomycetes bacterium]|nr:response regulator [Planctomycetota bacterium]